MKSWRQLVTWDGGCINLFQSLIVVGLQSSLKLTKLCLLWTRACVLSQAGCCDTTV